MTKTDIKIKILIGFLTLVFVTINPAAGREKVANEVCVGPYKGKRLSQAELEQVIKRHSDWRESYFGGGDEYTIVIPSDMKQALQDQRRANLCGAILIKADLTNANLSDAILTETDLSDAILTGAVLTGANLAGADLFRADLSKAKLPGADLKGANLSSANLAEADLWRANLTKAFLLSTRLMKANLWRTNLTGTVMDGADLTGANLGKAKLIEAKLVGTRIESATFTEVDLTNAQYQPDSSPLKGALSGIQGLTTVWFEKGKHSGLVLLRSALKDVGLRELERQSTYAIERGRTKYANWPERYFKRLFFEWTTDYGFRPGHALKILLAFIPVFAIPYMIILRLPGKDGIWRSWPDRRARKDLGRNDPEKLQVNSWKAIGLGLYFSILTAFHIGWREINVGNWIIRMQPREYTLHASGWIRTVSGIQSLISVYLVALWALTYFGRPFE